MSARSRVLRLSIHLSFVFGGRTTYLGSSVSDDLSSRPKQHGLGDHALNPRPIAKASYGSTSPVVRLRAKRSEC